MEKTGEQKSLWAVAVNLWKLKEKVDNKAILKKRNFLWVSLVKATLLPRMHRNFMIKSHGEKNFIFSCVYCSFYSV